MGEEPKNCPIQWKGTADVTSAPLALVGIDVVVVVDVLGHRGARGVDISAADDFLGIKNVYLPPLYKRSRFGEIQGLYKRSPAALSQVTEFV